MKVLVTGSSGFIGSALVPFLMAQGHTVARLARRGPSPGGGELRWDPEAGTIDGDGLVGMEAVVHLAGENIVSGRWTASRKARIRDSRVNGTRLLAEALARLEPRPSVLVCASASGYYGDRGDELLREEGGPGSDFLAQVTGEWEAAAEPAASAGVRVVTLRFGMVLDPRAGVLARMLTPFRLGLGGKLGDGRHYVSWIALEDAVRCINHALITPTLRGPVNAAAPGAVTNAELTRALGRALSRPTVVPAPDLLLRVLFGELAHSMVASTRLDPFKLQASGFVFRHPDLEGALRAFFRRS